MLRVRKEQFAVFEALARRRFEGELVAHLQGEFPEKSAALGEDGVRGLVTWAIERGRSYGFITEQQVCLFASAAFLLDPELETAREFRWARRILDDPEYAYPDQRLDALYEAIARYRGEDDDDDAGEYGG